MSTRGRGATVAGGREPRELVELARHVGLVRVTAGKSDSRQRPAAVTGEPSDRALEADEARKELGLEADRAAKQGDQVAVAVPRLRDHRADADAGAGAQAGDREGDRGVHPARVSDSVQKQRLEDLE